MVARDGVEPPVGIEPSEVADSTRDIRGRSDYLDIFPARIQYTDSMKFSRIIAESCLCEGRSARKLRVALNQLRQSPPRTDSKMRASGVGLPGEGHNKFK